jgi:small-conductance mechanosensitive channel
VESNELFQNNSLNYKKNSKEDKDKLEALTKKKAEIKTKIEQKEKEAQIKKGEYQLQVESLNKQKAQYVNKLQKDMKDQSKKEKDLVQKITQLSKELNVPLTFKLPEKGPMPVKGNSQKEKEYLELIKRYNECLKIGEKLFSGPRKNINDLDNQIKRIYKKYYGNNKSSQEEIFELKKEENSISNEIKKN